MHVSLIAWWDVFDEVDLWSGFTSFSRNTLPAINILAPKMRKTPSLTADQKNIDDESL